jgi:SAM-dependent methyltransferase
MTSDPRATRGFQTAVPYDRGRPPFPAAAVTDLVARLGLTPASAVLDLGAGSGRFTQTLASLVGQVVAVEPSPGMLDALRHRLPNIDARSGQPESIPLVDASVEAVLLLRHSIGSPLRRPAPRSLGFSAPTATWFSSGNASNGGSATNRRGSRSSSNSWNRSGRPPRR